MNHVSKERVSALSDGVIAIAATLLVLELKVPEDGQLTGDLIQHWGRTFLGWVISFAMIALLWFDNHFQMSHTSRWTVGLTAMTFVQLALLSLIPFGSNLIVDNPGSLFSALVFNGILLANGLCMSVTTAQVARREDIHISSESTRILQARVRFALLTYMPTAVMGVLGSVYHHPFTGVILWAMIPFVASLRSLWADQRAEVRTESKARG
jgi:uncharacterized membrane protein